MTDTEPTITINSRTLSVFSPLDNSVLENYLEDITVTPLESGRIYIECKSVDVSQDVYNALTASSHKVRIVSYSLFFRSKDVITEEESREIFLSMINCNIVYLRVDSNGHTGKLVVDTWDDYKAFKDFDDGEGNLCFYHFDKKAKSKRHKKNRKNRKERHDSESDVSESDSDESDNE